MVKEKFLVYINPYAALKSEFSVIKELLSKSIGDSWVFFDKMKIPEELIETMATTSFWEGIAFTQYDQIKTNGGTYLNPLYTGLNVDFEKWKKLIGGLDHCAAYYLDVPYSVYSQIDTTITEEKYNESTARIKDMVMRVNGIPSLAWH